MRWQDTLNKEAIKAISLHISEQEVEMQIRKAVIPVAGLGTRFLPATKAMPKEMLPVVDKPAIQYVVEESVNSGLPHILMITGRNKNALENHFDRAIELESKLEEKGDSSKLSLVEKATDIADIHYVRQGDPLGLGHAVLKAKYFVGDEPFAVLLGDDLIHESEHLLREMVALAEVRNAHVVALMEVPISDISKYGIAGIKNSEVNRVVEVNGFVEKPTTQDAPSNLAIIGRYVLQPEIFDVLETQKPGVSGEIQLTDALNLIARDTTKRPVFGLVFSGRRFDTGDKVSYLKSIVELASERNDLGEEFNNWLVEFVARDRS